MCRFNSGEPEDVNISDGGEDESLLDVPHPPAKSKSGKQNGVKSEKGMKDMFSLESSPSR